jgi:putative heme iron utilization protein
MSTGHEARRYLRHNLYGVLSTISKKLDGYPFGSVVPCVTDHAARPVILVSRLAEHTKNIDADPRVSLLVRNAGADPQESARLTLIGNARPAGDERAAVQARYLRYFPAAERLLALGDFSFFHIEPATLRYIGGFGAIHWISSNSYAPPANSLAVCEAEIVAHMNADHAAAMHEYCRHFKRTQPAMVSMIGIDCDGFDVRADDEIMRFDFAQPIVDAPTARAALKAMVAEARG